MHNTISSGYDEWLHGVARFDPSCGAQPPLSICARVPGYRDLSRWLSFLPRTGIARVSFAESRGSRRLADQAQPFAFRIIRDETRAVEEHGGVFGRIMCDHL